jgi:ketosteroid isomerase-like protein
MKYVAICIALFMLYACQSSKNDPLAALLETDKHFAELARDSGTGKAFIRYAADDVVKMNEGAAPIFGKKALEDIYGDMPDESPLIWEPIKAEISNSGDMGYTFGAWKWSYVTEALTDTTFTGVYVTIWKKDKQGDWKYVLDAGNITPPPSEWPNFRQ